MRKNILMTAGMLAIATAASAQFTVNYAAPTYSTLATRTQIYTVSGTETGGTFFNGICTFDDDGSVLFVGDPSGGSSAGTGLLDIVNGTTITVLATDAELIAATDDNAATDSDAVAIFEFGGNIYVWDREDNADLVQYNVVGDSMSSVFGEASNTGLAFSNTTVVGNFLYLVGGGASTGVWRLDLTNPGAGLTQLKTAADYNTAASVASSDWGNGATALVGDVIFAIDNHSFNGNTNTRVMKYDIGDNTLAPDSVVLGTQTWTGMAAVGNGEIVAWSENADPAQGGFVVYTTSGTPAATLTLTETVVRTGVGGATDVSMTEGGCLAARHVTLTPTTGELQLVFNNAVNTGGDATNMGNVYMVTFPTTIPVSNVSDWATFQ